MFLFDTDHIGVLQRRIQPEYGRLQHRMGLHPPGELYYSIVSFHEQVLGANQYISRARPPVEVAHGYSFLAMVLETFAKIQVLPFELPGAQMFDFLRARRIRIGTMDLRIAASALIGNMTVLTRNIKDFGRVPGLVVEDWTL